MNASIEIHRVTSAAHPIPSQYSVCVNKAVHPPTFSRTLLIFVSYDVFFQCLSFYLHDDTAETQKHIRTYEGKALATATASGYKKLCRHRGTARCRAMHRSVEILRLYETSLLKKSLQSTNDLQVTQGRRRCCYYIGRISLPVRCLLLQVTTSLSS